jgi:uncharacterized membrane protein
MNTRVLVASAFAAAIAAPSLLSAQKPAEMPSFKAEKCYGIAKAGKNDCASAGNNSCAGNGTALFVLLNERFITAIEPQLAGGRL